MNEIRFVNEKGNVLAIGNSSEFDLIDIAGTSPPKANINTGTITGFDGATYIGSSVNMRNIILTLQVNGDIEENRLNLYDCFKIKRKGILYYSSDLIDVKIEAYVESVDAPPMNWPVTAVISLLCPQPYFEALDEIIADISSIDYQLTFPLELFSTGIQFGILTPLQTVNIINPGDIPIGMIIKYTATGSVVKPKVINTVTLEFIELDTTLISGDVITITTEYGKKRIERNRSGVITNLFNALVVGSTFLQLNEGDNVLYGTSESGSSALMMAIQYRPRYAGV